MNQLTAVRLKIKVSDGTELFVSQFGRNQPCLFIHGGPGYSALSFEEIVGHRLAPNMQLIGVDQRGCGRSEWSTDYSLRRLIQDFEDIRLNLGISEWIIMAHSWGGILAVNYLLHFRPAVKGVILINCTLHVRESIVSQIEEAQRILGRVIPSALLNERYFLAIENLIRTNTFNTLQFVSQENAALIHKLDSALPPCGSDPKFIINAFSNIQFIKDYKSVINDLDVPVHVIHGINDHAVGVDHHLGFKFKRASFTAINGKHHPYLESINEFDKAVLQFLKTI